MKIEIAIKLQAALRNYEEARKRLLAAAEPNEVKSAAENLIKAKQRWKAAEREANEDERQIDRLVDIVFERDDADELRAIAKGEGGHSFAERVDAFLKLLPEAPASQISDETGIPHAAVLSVFEERAAAEDKS